MEISRKVINHPIWMKIVVARCPIVRRQEICISRLSKMLVLTASRRQEKTVAVINRTCQKVTRVKWSRLIDDINSWLRTKKRTFITIPSSKKKRLATSKGKYRVLKRWRRSLVNNIKQQGQIRVRLPSDLIVRNTLRNCYNK